MSPPVGAPHSPQNRAPGDRDEPHEGQNLPGPTPPGVEVGESFIRVNQIRDPASGYADYVVSFSIDAEATGSAPAVMEDARKSLRLFGQTLHSIPYGTASECSFGPLMMASLAVLRDGSGSSGTRLEIPDWNFLGDVALPETAATADGRIRVEELVSRMARENPLAGFRPLIIVTGCDLERSGCGSLFGYADRTEQIGVVSTFRLGQSGSELAKSRLVNVIRHELGHLEGRSHCRQPGCLMHPVRRPEDLDGRSSEPCPRCMQHRTIAAAIRHRVAACLFLVLVFTGVNLAASLLKPAPPAPFAATSRPHRPAAGTGSMERLFFNGTPVDNSASLVNPHEAPEELNRLFLLVDPPVLGVAPRGGGEAAILSGETELLRVRHDQPMEEAARLASVLNGLLAGKGTRSSLCAECHLERKPEVLEAASGRRWGIGPF